jgi:hypothetical protein
MRSPFLSAALCAGLCVALLSPNLLAERWTLQYFFDEEHSRLELIDLAFPSAERGIAIGFIQPTASDRSPRPTTLITSDGGAHWTLSPLKEEPRSLFFLNDSLGWLVTDKAIWVTQESGRSWRRASEQKKPDPKLGQVPPGGLILRVWFLDEQHGFAVGYQKTVLETRDGGKNWTPVEEASKPAGNPAFTAYTNMAFEGPLGLIAGAAVPPRRQPYPRWMDPDRAASRRQTPTETLVLETHNGGSKWVSQGAPVFGVVGALRLAGAVGLNVMQFQDTFDWPAEVYLLDFASGKSTSVFREKNRLVTDAALFPPDAAGQRAFLAAVEPPGRVSGLPIPGKVKMLTSTDLKEWNEMQVDYRAVATSVVLSGPDPSHVWAATDTGMILHLVK